MSRKLGETAYVVKDDGTLARTEVNVLYPGGGYGMLKFCMDSRHFFSFAEARGEAESILRAKKAALEEQLRELARLQERIKSPSYQQEVDAAPLVDDSNAAAVTGVVYKAGLVPEAYLDPDSEVFGVITPKTHYQYSGGHGGPPYFILRTRIKEVSTRSGFLSYWLAAQFIVHNGMLFGSQEEAQGKLIEVFAQETGGVLAPESVKVLSQQELSSKGLLAEEA